MELPKLDYGFEALEPHIDAKTMEIHHDKHHQAYLNKFLAAIEGHDDLKEKGAVWILQNLDQVPEEIRTAVKNNGGGFVNHALFWKIIGPNSEFKGEVADAINESFGSYEEFKKEFANAAATQFGSGWAWLVINDGNLDIVKTLNQDTPLSEGKKPILCIDVWEHAYYLKYQNKRPDYIEAFFNVINWEQVNAYFKGEEFIL